MRLLESMHEKETTLSSQSSEVVEPAKLAKKPSQEALKVSGDDETTSVGRLALETARRVLREAAF